jgi:transposase
MRYIGIDIGKDKHVVAVVNEDGGVLVKATSFTEDLDGYQKLFEMIGKPDDTLVVMEATGHYWMNLCGALVGSGFGVAVINPVRTHRFAEEDLARAKTDAIDAVSLARFGAQKKPAPTRLPDEATVELREMVRLRDRYVQDLGDRVRQLHRVVDLGFPELTRHVKELDSALATTLLGKYPSAAEFAKQSPKRLAALVYDGRHEVGIELATALVEAAKISVGRHRGATFKLETQHACEDIATLRSRIRQLDKDLGSTIGKHDVGSLLLTIDGIGDITAARLIAELGDPAGFRDAGALAAYVGVVPATNHSGKRRPVRAPISSMGNAALRAKLWMPVLTAVRRNAWLKHFHDGLIARGKLPKVALIASMRKLLAAVYSVAKNRKPFVPRLPSNAVAAASG